MAEDKIKRLTSMSEQVNLIRLCMADTFQGILDALQSSNPTAGKERYEIMLKTNSDLVNQSLRRLGDLAIIEGGSSWLVTPPGGIGSVTTPLSAAVSAIEDPVSVIEHSLQGAAGEEVMETGWLASTAARSADVMACFQSQAEPFLAAKKRRIDYIPQDQISDLDSIITQVTSKDPNMKIKTIEDPLYPDMITAVSFSYTHVFHGQFIFGLPTAHNTVSIERIEMRGIDEPSSPSRSRHHLFEAIAAQALAAHDYYVRHHPGAVLIRMLTWIASFGRLFAAECAGCGKMLYLDSSRSPASEGPVFLPPTLRTYTSLLPFHPQCCTKKDA